MGWATIGQNMKRCARVCVCARAQKIILGTKRTLEKEPLNWILLRGPGWASARKGWSEDGAALTEALLPSVELFTGLSVWAVLEDVRELVQGFTGHGKGVYRGIRLRPAPEAVWIRYSTAQTDKPGHICHPNGQLLLIPAGLRRLWYCQILSVVLQGKAKTADFYVKISPIIKESWNRIEYICLQHPSQITTCVWR